MSNSSMGKTFLVALRAVIDQISDYLTMLDSFYIKRKAPVKKAFSRLKNN